MDIYNNISPLDYRYYHKKELFDRVEPYLTENGFIKYQLRVEAALSNTLADYGICPKKAAKQIENACRRVKPADIYREDKKTKHYTKALVNSIRKKIPGTAKPFVHFTATSFDIFDTANSVRYKEFAEKVLIPEMKAFEKTLIKLSLREKKTIQVGRTHGQHAIPITFGFYMAEYVSRLGSAIQRVEITKDNLIGKMSGAVGAYNSQSIFIKDPLAFEKTFLSKLNLKAATSSKQIIEPEPLLDFIHAVISAYGIMANLADDLRHLQRTEIAEVAEKFDSKTQVGSSTMPHKMNPWNFENVKSMWKQTMPRIITYYMDQISEHQRDLSNSASSRFVPEMLAAYFESLTRLHGLVRKLIVNEDKMKSNFNASKGLLAAEPLYLLLSFYGHPNGHEAVRKLTLKARAEGKGLPEIIPQEKELKPYLEKFSDKQKKMLLTPETYSGQAAKKTEKICNYWKKELKL